MFYGKKVLMRPVEESDQEFLVRLNSDPAVRANVAGWGFPTSLNDQMNWFKGGGSESTQRYIIEESGQPVGMTGLWNIDWHNRHAIAPIKLGGGADIRGKGLGKDAIMALMAFAFYDVGLNRLHGPVLTDNVASMKLYVEKCGWSVEGTLRSHVWRNGRFVNESPVGILRDEFDALPEAPDYIRIYAAGLHQE